MTSVSVRPYFLLLKSRGRPMAFAFHAGLASLVAFISVGGDLSAFGRDLVLSVLSMLATALSVYIYNDLTDIEIDRLNKPNRPLVTGEASEKHARNLVVFLGFIGFATALMVNLIVFLLILTYFVLFFVYSFPVVRLKNKFILNKTVIGTGIALSCLIGGAAVRTMPAPIFLMGAYGFLGTMVGSILLDLHDVKGDELHKVRSLPVVWGPKLTIRLLIALVCLMGTGTVVGALQLGFNIVFPILSSCTFAAWVYVLFPLFSHWDNPSHVTRTIHRTYFLGFVLQLLIVLGALL